jgi:hypothetical protein
MLVKRSTYPVQGGLKGIRVAQPFSIWDLDGVGDIIFMLGNNERNRPHDLTIQSASESI